MIKITGLRAVSDYERYLLLKDRPPKSISVDKWCKIYQLLRQKYVWYITGEGPKKERDWLFNVR